LSLVSFSISQNIDDLSEDNFKEYNKNKIRIEKKNSLIFNKSNEFHIYKGFEEISISEFLVLTGYDDVMSSIDIEKSFEKTKLENSFKFRIPTYIISIILVFLEYGTDSVNDFYAAIPLYAYTVIDGSITLKKYIEFKDIANNPFSYLMAVDMSEEYNRKLLLEIKNSQ